MEQVSKPLVCSSGLRCEKQAWLQALQRKSSVIISEFWGIKKPTPKSACKHRINQEIHLLKQLLHLMCDTVHPNVDLKGMVVDAETLLGSVRLDKTLVSYGTAKTIHQIKVSGLACICSI